MSNTFKITCPSCKKEFDADSAFNLHFEKAKKEAGNKAEMDAAKKYKSQIESAAKEIEIAKKETEIKAKKIATEELKELERKKDTEILQMKNMNFEHPNLDKEITNEKKRRDNKR